MLELQDKLDSRDSLSPANPSELPAVFGIDDDRDHMELLTRVIAQGVAHGHISVGLPLHGYSDPAEAIAAFPVNRPVVVLLDYQLNDGTAMDWISEIVKRDVGPIILITSEGGEQVAAQVFREGVSDYLTKLQISQSPDSLYVAIRQGLRRFKLSRRNRELTSRLKEANEALQQRAEHLRKLTETAHRFVDDVAHEFRNPLTVIQMFASNIEDGLGGPVSDRQKEFLAYIGTATRDLSQLIDDFLDSSRLKNGILRVDRKPHSARELLAIVRTPLEARARHRRIALRETVDPMVPELYFDLEKAGRVLINLTVNAIKFSPDGADVEIAVRPSPDGGAAVSVKDHGQGIPEEELARIQTRFGQARNANPGPRTRGFGLGLNIAHDMVHLNFGRLEIQSHPGEGSAFSFSLCANDPQQILGRYLETALAISQSEAITVLHVTPAPGGKLDLAREFISSICFPMDLLLPVRRTDSLLLIGGCDRPRDWIARLHAQWQGRTPAFNELSAFDIYCVGSWRRPELDRALPQCVANHLSFQSPRP